MTETQQKEDAGYVVDTLALLGPRVHGVKLANGVLKNYELFADKPVEMPLDHAMRFLCADTFIVTDAAGKILKPLENLEHATNVPVPYGFVLARYEELSRDALVLRCKLLPGSEAIHPKKTSVADMTAFLLSTQPKPAEGREPSKESLDKLFAEHGVDG